MCNVRVEDILDKRLLVTKSDFIDFENISPNDLAISLLSI